jgi:hypothetical protein
MASMLTALITLACLCAGTIVGSLIPSPDSRLLNLLPDWTTLQSHDRSRRAFRIRLGQPHRARVITRLFSCAPMPDDRALSLSRLIRFWETL